MPRPSGVILAVVPVCLAGWIAPRVPALDLDEHADPVVGAVLVGLAKIAMGESVYIGQFRVLPDLDRAPEERELVVPVVPEHGQGAPRLATQVTEPVAVSVH